MEISHKFYKCNHCGNVAVLVVNKGVPVVCCGEKMTDLPANSTDASLEKHVPELTVAENTIGIQIGSVPHPTEEGHHIDFVYIATENGGQRKRIKIGSEPKCTFSFSDDKPVTVYAYCNLHGLWKTEI